jgi:endo-1,4-beta-xylanase
MSSAEWTQVLGEDPLIVTQRLEKEGLLARASLAHHLHYKFNVEELKGLLEERGLSTSGTKNELILRLIHADYEGMSKAVYELRLLQCSEKGGKLVEEYLREIVVDPNAALRNLRIPADKSGEVIKWILGAIAAGVLGNIAYDALKEFWENITETPYTSTPTPTAIPTFTATPTPAPPPPVPTVTPERPRLRPHPKGTETVRQEFNLCAIAIYWSETEPQRDSFDFSSIDRQISQANDMVLRGQSLVFPAILPEWLLMGSFSRDELTRILRNYIERVVNRYKGKIREWVVVNQPYRQNDIFYRIIGPDYVEISFQSARAAEPSAILIHSDIDNYISTGRTTHLTRHIVQRLKSKGLIDSVELQAYLDGANLPDKQDVIATMKSYGIPVYVALDVNMQGFIGTQSQRYVREATIYEEMVEACLQSGVCKGFNLYRADALFDENLQRKPAYYAIMRAMMKGLEKQ